MLKTTEIMTLLSRLLVDELHYPAQNEDVFDRALATILMHYELNSRPQTISAINSLPGQEETTINSQRPQTEPTQGQTDAAASSPAHFVNRPWVGDAWPSEMLRRSVPGWL